jgi:hypothetical protein
MAAANNLLGDCADTQAMSTAQAMGVYVRRASDAVHKRVVIEGGVVSIDKLLEHGQSLVPVREESKSTRSASQFPAWKVKLALDGLPNDETTDYTKWMLTAGGVFSALKEDGLDLFQEWSARNPAKHDAEYSETKYLQHVANLRFDADGLMWTAHGRAKDIAHTLGRPATQPSHFAHLPTTPRDVTINAAFSAGIAPRRQPQMLDTAKLVVQFGSTSAALAWAVAFMKACWSDAVFQTFLTTYNPPADAVEAGEAHAANLLEAEKAAGRAVLTLADTIHENIEQIAAAMSQKVAAGTLELFQQGGTTLTHIRRSEQGTRGVALLEPASLRTVLSEHIVFKLPPAKGGRGPRYISPMYSGKGPVPTLDQGLLKDLLQRRLQEALPELLSVATAPFMPYLPTTGENMLHSGADQIITARGYHAPSKLYLALGDTPQYIVPSLPTPEQVQAAVALLWKPFAGFTWENQEVARGIILLAALVAAFRPVLATAPGIAVSAPAMSSGKTLLCQVLAMITAGRSVSVATMPPSFDEQEKRLLSMLMDGDQAIILDNITSRIDSSALNAIITSPYWTGRLLGQSKSVRVSTRTLILANGNSLPMSGDISSRFLYVALGVSQERSQDRASSNFEIPELYKWVRDNRQGLIAAAQTIVRAFLIQCRNAGGVPESVVTKRVVPGSRFPCIDVLRDALLWCGEGDGFVGFREASAHDKQHEERTQVLQVVAEAIKRANEKEGASPGTPITVGKLWARIDCFGDDAALLNEIVGRGRYCGPYGTVKNLSFVLGRWLTDNLVDGIYGGKRLRSRTAHKQSEY